MAANSPFPWTIDPICTEALRDAVGELVVDCGARPTTTRERAQANADLIQRAVRSQAAYASAIAMARRLAEPFADIDDEYLEEVVSADPGSLHLIGGKGLTAHFARAILDARAAVALEEDR